MRVQITDIHENDGFSEVRSAYLGRIGEFSAHKSGKVESPLGKGYVCGYFVPENPAKEEALALEFLGRGFTFAGVKYDILENEEEDHAN